MTLSQLLADLYRRTGYASTPATEITTRYTAFLNAAHRQILTKPWAKRLRDDTITVASVSGQELYPLSPAVAKIEHITDRTNRRPLIERDLGWLRTRDPGASSVGGPSTVYIPRGTQRVAKQPSDSSTLYVVSTSAADTTQTAYLQGVVDVGTKVAFSTSVTLTGMTAVSLGSGWVEVSKFYLSAPAAGFVTLREDTGAGTELAFIQNVIATSVTYLVIQLWPTPTSAITYHVDYVRVIPDLVNATDEPLLPEDFHELLVLGALRREWSKKDDLARRTEVKEEYVEMEAALRSWIVTNPDTVSSLRATRHGWSSLGPSYPSEWSEY